jgi:hypothetical protein
MVQKIKVPTTVMNYVISLSIVSICNIDTDSQNNSINYYVFGKYTHLYHFKTL